MGHDHLCRRQRLAGDGAAPLAAAPSAGPSAARRLWAHGDNPLKGLRFFACVSVRDRPIEGDWPYLWIDATYVKVREAGRIVSVAAIIAVAVNSEGMREALGMAIGPPEAVPFWSGFLRSLMRRGLRGVRLVISDAHEGIKAAIAKVLKATWQRCRVNF